MTTRALDAHLTLDQTTVGSLGNNSYLLTTADGHSLLIDAAADSDALIGLLAGRTVETIVTTHRHHDHVGALAAMVEATGATALAGRPDVDSIAEQSGIVCQPLWTGDVIELGAHRIEVIGLVGHTPGSITLVVRPADGPVQLFTGDSPFPGGVGKTFGPENFTSLLDDVTRELFARFDDDTVVWPGHGAPTTLGVERPHLDEWRQRGW